MTNADQPQNITERLNDIDERLEQLGDEIDLIRTIQNGNRRELRANSQTTARLERTVAQLADIARDHQLALRIASQDAERDRTVFQAEIRRIWEYLLQQGGNGNTPPSN
jgi:NAD-dependent oxidoreductase involved in siderophore biosynthesis